MNGRWSTSNHHVTQLNPTLVNVPKNNSAKKEIFIKVMKIIAINNRTFIPPRTNKAISNLLRHMGLWEASESWIVG